MDLEAQRLELGPRELHFEPGLAAFEAAGAVVRAERAAGDEQQTEDEQIDQQDGRKLPDEGLPEVGAWNRQERLEPYRQLRGDDHVKGAQAHTNQDCPSETAATAAGPGQPAASLQARPRRPAPRTTSC